LASPTSAAITPALHVDELSRAVQLFHIDLKRTALPATLERILSADERARAARFHAADTRSRFIAGRTLLRTVLATYFPPIRPQEWAFSTSPAGRPMLGDPPLGGRLSFNISHSASDVLIAITALAPLGVDVEKPRTRDPVFEVLTASEISQLCRLPRPQQRDRYRSLWSLKEAFTKALSAGTDIPFRAVGFRYTRHSATHDTISATFMDRALGLTENWCFTQTWLAGAVLSLAVREASLDAVLYRRIRTLHPDITFDDETAITPGVRTKVRRKLGTKKTGPSL
jgi:phosphopantetheinyl transferase